MGILTLTFVIGCIAAPIYGVCRLGFIAYQVRPLIDGSVFEFYKNLYIVDGPPPRSRGMSDDGLRRLRADIVRQLTIIGVGAGLFFVFVKIAPFLGLTAYFLAIAPWS